MMDLYTGKSQLRDRDLDDLRSEGKTALARGRHQEAIELLFAALWGHGQAREEDYSRVLGLLREAFAALGRVGEAISIDWYTGDRSKQQELLPKLSPIDRARTLLRWSAPGVGGARQALAAAEPFEAAGQLVRAAIAYERGGDWERARALWSRLATRLASGPRLYEAALAHFNLYRTAHQVGQTGDQRAAGVAAVHLLEEAADRYESGGQRERAFDCFQTLIAIGNEMQVYEHVLEGYVNVTRILCEDHLRNHALDTFQEAIDSARDHGELVAAATMAHEMAAYARKEGEGDLANHAVLLEAKLWREVAEQSLRRGSPVAAAEHALLAAVLALGEVAQYRSVGEVYTLLSRLPLPAHKQSHYARAGVAADGARDEPLESPGAPGRPRDSLPRFWHDDLIEWEEDGEAVEVCADVLQNHDNEQLRRHALLARLVALAAAERPADPQAQVQLCSFLANLQLYPVVAVLEKLLRHPSPQVREAAIAELGNFRFKRTFQSIRQALEDTEAKVAQRATDTIVKMAFPHALEPLTRILREARMPSARKAAIRAMANIEHLEAGETLLGILSFGTPDDRASAVEAIKSSHRKAFSRAARLAKSDLDPATRQLVASLFQQRGHPPF
ncbi:MAG: HEAT repeat domain-containing protein [Myxococcales bacterium]|nr:MAG: HEAT repeat domain-containing protein [Myxococcales bacterium]